MELMVGCVGKPSAGKSTFLNAATEANAKVGSYPFTTIDPNHGVTYFPVSCPCKRFGKSSHCSPRYGWCSDGTRYIPIKMIDVAGLIPGASEGKGLGNKFLDDLRHADVLMHVLDVSGTTNEKGEETTGYDPIGDAEWLKKEIHDWIFNNLWTKWGSIVRRHLATKSNIATTLQNQFSGYGTKPAQSQEVCDSLGLKDPLNIEEWDKEKVHEVVDAFIEVRFPTILVLNKADMPEADRNILRLCRKYDEKRIVPVSALAECFLKKLNKQGFIRYKPEDGDFVTADDDDSGKTPALKPMDGKTQARVEKIRDMVLFRYGGTGVVEAIRRAVMVKNPIPVFPTKSISQLSNTNNTEKVFRDCVLVPPGTTVRELARILHPDIERNFIYAEVVLVDRIVQVGENDLITPENNVIKFTTSQNDSGSGASSTGAGKREEKK